MPRDVIFASPGRLFDYVQKKSMLKKIYFQNVFLSVLDEADAMFDMGFKVHLNAIVAELPQNRQKVYYSATFPSEIIGSIPNYSKMKKIVTIAKNSEATATNLENHYIVAKQDQFHKVLLGLLKQYENKKIIAFVPTKNATIFYELFLQSAGFNCIALSGKTSNNQRIKTYDNFKNSTSSILLTTDVSARGVDYTNVDLVLVISKPSSPDVFIHQSGRTARAGKKGECICLLYDLQSIFIEHCKSKKIIFDSRKQPTEYLNSFQKMKLNLDEIFGYIDENVKQSFIISIFNMISMKYREFGINNIPIFFRALCVELKMRQAYFKTFRMCKLPEHIFNQLNAPLPKK